MLVDTLCHTVMQALNQILQVSVELGEDLRLFRLGVAWT